VCLRAYSGGHHSHLLASITHYILERTDQFLNKQRYWHRPIPNAPSRNSSLRNTIRVHNSNGSALVNVPELYSNLLWGTRFSQFLCWWCQPNAGRCFELGQHRFLLHPSRVIIHCQPAIRAHKGHVPETTVNGATDSVKICKHTFSESNLLILSFCTLTYIVNIVCFSFGRHRCATNTKRKSVR